MSFEMGGDNVEPGGESGSDLEGSPIGGQPASGTADAATQELTGGSARADAEDSAVAAARDTDAQLERRGGRLRRIAVGVLVVLFTVLLAVTYVVGWAHYVVLSETGFQKTVVPVGTDPAVTSAMATTLTDQIFTALNAQQAVANALPPKADFLAGPITNATKGYVQDGVTQVLQSSQFQTLWTQAVHFAHQQLLSVLKGNSKAVTTTDGQVVLNLVPLFNAALQHLEGFVSGVVGKPVQLPSISADEIPATACQKIGAALDRPVPNTCGQIPLFPADKLTQARHLVRIFDGVLVLLLVLTPLAAAAALWLSRRRRRTLLQLSAAGVLGLVAIRRVVDWVTTALVNTGQPANKSARRAIVTHLFHQYFSISRWLLVGLILVFVVALVTGPYDWARSLRRVVSHWAREARNLAGATAGKGRDDSTRAWVGSHLDLLRIAGVAVAVLLLVVISVSWVGLLVIVVLLAAYELALLRISRSRLSSASATTPGSPPAGPPDEHPPAPTEPGPAPVR
jgi:hypothetical protein